MIWLTQFIVESILEAYMARPVLYTSAAFVDRSRWPWFLDCFDVSSKHGTNMISHSSFRGPISNPDLQFCCRCLVGVLPVLAFANSEHVADGESIALDYWWISDVLDYFASNMLSRIEARGLLREQKWGSRSLERNSCFAVIFYGVDRGTFPYLGARRKEFLQLSEKVSSRTALDVLSSFSDQTTFEY